jgi:hypothetical protein
MLRANMQRNQKKKQGIDVYLGALVIDGDLVVLVRILACEKLSEGLVDVYLEAAGLQRGLIWGRCQRMGGNVCCCVL